MGNNKKYYWLRLKEDFFNSKEMRKLRTIAGGEVFTIIYLKLQLLSLKGEGKIFFEHIDKTISHELELIIDEKKENIDITLKYLLSVGLLECIGDEYILPKVLECIGSETSCAERVRRHREKIKSSSKMLQCNTDVTNCNAFLLQCNTEREKEREKEIDRDRDNSTIVKLENSSTKLAGKIQEIFDYWKKSHNHPKAKLDNKRTRIIKKAVGSFSMDDLKQAIDGCKKSKFHMGQNRQSKVFDDIELILRDNKHIEYFLESFNKKTLEDEFGCTEQDEEAYNAVYNS